MEILSNPFSATLVISSLLIGALSFYIAYMLSDSTRWIAVTMILVCIWGFFYGLELSSTTHDQMLFWIDYEYIGISFMPAAWLVFSLQYTGYKKWQSPLILVAIFLIPILTFLAVITNDFHHLHYLHTEVNTSSPFPVLSIEVGPWYYIHTAYSYIAFVTGTLILWKRFRFADPIFRTQTKLLIIAGFFPLILNVLYQLHIIKPFDGIDLTPFSFLLTYLLLGFAILRYSLFSLKPIAQNRIMEALNRGVLVIDARQKIVDFNPALKNFCRQPEKISIGVSIKNLFEENEEILDLINSKKESSITISIPKHPEDQIIKVDLIQMDVNKSGVYGEILLFDDQTEQFKINKRLREQKKDLEQLNDLKDKFFSIISHDLKGPIFGVKELVYMTQTGLISEEEFMELLPELSKNMEQVAILLQNLLAWASSQIRGEQLNIENFEINHLLQQQQKLLLRISQEKNIQIEIDSTEDLWVSADKNMIDLVLRNLINNAIKFSKTGEKVLLSTSLSGNRIKICVEDTGTGISPENLEKIHEGTSFTTRGQNNESGTGLGLVLVKDYVDKNNGKLSITSELGKGSKFCLELPKGSPETT